MEKFQTYTEVEPYIMNAHVFITDFKANPSFSHLYSQIILKQILDPIISSVNISS